MAIKVKNGVSTWTSTKGVYTKTGVSTWKPAKQIFTKTGASTWKSVYISDPPVVNTKPSLRLPNTSGVGGTYDGAAASTPQYLDQNLYGKDGSYSNYTSISGRQITYSDTEDGFVRNLVVSGDLFTSGGGVTTADRQMVDDKYLFYELTVNNGTDVLDSIEAVSNPGIRMIKKQPTYSSFTVTGTPDIGAYMFASITLDYTWYLRPELSTSHIKWYIGSYAGDTSSAAVQETTLTQAQDSLTSTSYSGSWGFTIPSTAAGKYLTAVVGINSSWARYNGYYEFIDRTYASYPLATKIYSTPIPGPKTVGTVTLTTDTGNYNAGSVITINPVGWSGYASYEYKLYYSTTSPVSNTSSTASLGGTNGNQYTITALDARSSSYYFRGEIIGYTGANKTGTASSAILSDTSPISTLVPTSTISVGTATSNGFTISGTASASGNYSYASIDAILIYNSSQSLLTTITTGLPTVNSSDGTWSYIWNGGSATTTYYAKVRIKANDTNGTLYTSGFSSSIQTLATAPSSFYFTISQAGSVTTPSTPSITRVSSTSNTVLFEVGSSFPSDTSYYGINQSGAAFGTRTGNPAQTVTTLNQWDSSGNFGSGIYDTISSIEPGSNSAAMTISTTAYGKTRVANANVDVTSGAASWAINFSWSNATSGSVTYYSNGTGFTSSSTSATVTVYTNSMPIKIIEVTGTSDPTITINSITAYSGSNQTGSTTAGASGVAYGYKVSDIILRPTSTSNSTTQYYTYYDPTPSQSTAPSIAGGTSGGEITVKYPGSISWSGGTYTNASSVTSVLLYSTALSGLQSSTSTNYRTANPYSLSTVDPSGSPYYFGVRDTVVGTNGTTYYYYSYPNRYVLSALGDALTPSLSASTSTSGGFYFDVNNYDANYTWSSSVTSGTGSSSGPTTSSPYRVTVTGMGSSATSTVTVSTSRSGYNSGSATRSGTSQAAPAVTVNSYPTISGSGYATTNITFGSGSYNNAASVTKTLRASTTTSFSTGSTSKGSTSPYQVTASDATSPAYYFATLDTVVGNDGLTYYFWSGGYSGSSVTIPSGSGSILSKPFTTPTAPAPNWGTGYFTRTNTSSELIWYTDYTTPSGSYSSITGMQFQIDTGSTGAGTRLADSTRSYPGSGTYPYSGGGTIWGFKCGKDRSSVNQVNDIAFSTSARYARARLVLLGVDGATYYGTWTGWF